MLFTISIKDHKNRRSHCVKIILLKLNYRHCGCTMSFTFSRTDTIELRICLSAREFIAFSNFSKLWPYGGSYR